MENRVATNLLARIVRARHKWVGLALSSCRAAGSRLAPLSSLTLPSVPACPRAPRRGPRVSSGLLSAHQPLLQSKRCGGGSESGLYWYAVCSNLEGRDRNYACSVDFARHCPFHNRRSALLTETPRGGYCAAWVRSHSYSETQKTLGRPFVPRYISRSFLRTSAFRL